MMGRHLILAFILFSVPAFAQDLSGFAKVLLPVYTRAGIGGANGTKFSTPLMVTIDPDVPLRYHPHGDYFGTTPSFGQTLHQQGFLLFEPIPASAGRLLFVDASQIDHVSFGYWLHSQSPLGAFDVELPVVRESAFRFGRSYIDGVPLLPIIEQPPGQPARPVIRRRPPV